MGFQQVSPARRLAHLSLLLLLSSRAQAFQLKRSAAHALASTNSASRHTFFMTSTTQEPQPLTIAILGGGISGLSCASHLLSDGNSRSMHVTLFDTGRLRPGGRCASRLAGDEPAKSFVGENKRSCTDENADCTDSSTDNRTAAHRNIVRMLQRSSSQSTSRDRILGMGPVDHAAQILSIPSSIASLRDETIDRCFHRQVQEWLESGVIRAYPDGSVCELVADSNYDNKTPSQEVVSKSSLIPIEGEMYYGKGGMTSIPLAMRDYCLSRSDSDHSFTIHQDVWVSPSNGVRYIGNPNSPNDEPQWELRAGSKSLGKFHRLVIAHNGKCADRIMSKTPAKAFHSLLRTKFAPSVPQSGGREMTLNSIYSLVFAVKCDNSDGKGSAIAAALKKKLQSTASSESTTKDICTVMIRNEPNLRLLSSNTLKHGHTQNPSSDNNIEIYTLLSSPTFGKRYKGPQENLPLDLMETVTIKLLQSLEKALDAEDGSILESVIDWKLQLWGAAVPLNTWTGGADEINGFVYDSQYNVGACGDWILDSNIAGAWESGRRLADWIANGDSKQSVGLPNLDGNSESSRGKFVPSRAALESGIGSVCSTPNSKYEFPTNTNGGGRGGQRGTGRGAGRGGRHNTGRGGRYNAGRGGRRNNNRNVGDRKEGQPVSR